MTRKLVRTLLVIIILVIICTGMAFALLKSNFIRGWYNDLVLDRKDHFLIGNPKRFYIIPCANEIEIRA
jgi:hypothetical protein